MASHNSSEVRFAAYVAALVDVIGHADRGGLVTRVGRLFGRLKGALQ